MGVALERERITGQRLRPARQPRWRLYAPALVVTLLAISAALADGWIAQQGAQLGLGAHTSATITAGLVVLLATLTAALCDRPPARWFIAGILAVSLGANITAVPWLFTPLVILGLAAITAREIERSFDGVTLGATALTLHRPLKDALTVNYEDVNAVHTSPALGKAGTLILETEHGTVTARGLPRVGDIQARIEARLAAPEVEDVEKAARHARETIQDIVRGKATS